MIKNITIITDKNNRVWTNVRYESKAGRVRYIEYTGIESIPESVKNFIQNHNLYTVEYSEIGSKIERIS